MGGIDQLIMDDIPIEVAALEDAGGDLDRLPMGNLWSGVAHCLGVDEDIVLGMGEVEAEPVNPAAAVGDGGVGCSGGAKDAATSWRGGRGIAVVPSGGVRYPRW